jgi:hypothetical protein
MALTDKTAGYGTTVKLGSDTIARVRSITPATLTRDDVEATTLDSTVEDFLAGDPPNVGELLLDLVWKPGATNDELLETAFAGKTNGSWTIVWPSSINKTDAFTGYINQLAPAVVESKTVISRQVKIRLTSAITRTTTNE